MKKVYTVSRIDVWKNSKEYVSTNEYGDVFFFRSKELAEDWIKDFGDKYGLYSIDKMYHNVPVTEEEEVKNTESEKKTYSDEEITHLAKVCYNLGGLKVGKESLYKYLKMFLK